MKPNTKQPTWRLPLIALGVPVTIALLAAVPMLLFMPERKTASPPPAEPAAPSMPAVAAAPSPTGPAFQSMVRPDDPKFKARPVEQRQVVTPAPAPISVPPGWEATKHPGVFWRWCRGDVRCPVTEDYGDNAYALAQVWCKDRACGNVYATVNVLMPNGIVVGNAIDSGFGSKGQIIQLSFNSVQEGRRQFVLTELDVRG